MLAILRRRDFALLWGAGVVSTAGDWALLVALPVYVYSLTSSAAWTGGAFIAYMLPRLVIGSVAGVLADRWDRKATIVAADITRAVVLVALLLVRSRDHVWLVYVVELVESVAAEFFGPASEALLPRLVPDEGLLAANALSSLTSGVARLAAPALGGILVAWLGIGGAVGVDVASFLLSALLISRIATPSHAPSEGTAKGAITGVDHTSRNHEGMAHGGRIAVQGMADGWWASMWRDWRDGIGYVARQRPLVVLCMVGNLISAEYGIMTVLLVVFVRRVLGGGAVEYGLATAAWGVGSLVASFAAGATGHRVTAPRLYGWCVLGMGAGMLAAFSVRSLGFCLPFLAIAGFGMVGSIVGGQTILQTAVPDAYRGRVLGAFSTTYSALALGGMALGSLLGDRLGPVPMLLFAGCLDVVGGFLALAFLRDRAGTPTASGASAQSA